MRLSTIPPLLALLLGSACTDDSRFDPPITADRFGAWAPDSMDTILRAEQSGMQNPTIVVASDSVSWDALWHQAWTGVGSAPPLPWIDFVLNSVVVVGLGERAAPGVSVTIDSVVIYTTGSVLYATAWQPGVHCNTAGGTSSPVHMVHAPGHPPLVNWYVATARRDCAP